MSSVLCVQPCTDYSPFHNEQITTDRPLMHCYSCRSPLTTYEGSDHISHHDCPFALRLVNESGINVHEVRDVNSQLVECTIDATNSCTLSVPIKIENRPHHTRRSFESKSHLRQWIIVTYVSMYVNSNGSDSENDESDENCSYDGQYFIINKVLSTILVYPGIDYRPRTYTFDDELVMSQTGASIEAAEEALAMFSGDIVEAIMFLTPESSNH